MKKLRSDAKWNGLSAEQQQQLENWLFDEHLGYDEALDRAKQELGFDGSRASLQRFYKYKAQERLIDELKESGQEAEEVEQSGVDTGKLRKSGMKVMAQRLFRQMRDEGIADVPLMAKLVLQGEANEIQREEKEIQRASLELRRQRLEFQRETWMHSHTDETEAEKESPEEAEAREAAEDPYAYNRRTNAMRKKMWGMEDLPDLLPESAEEEAALAAAAAAEEERLRPEREARQREFEKGRAKFFASMGMTPPPSELEPEEKKEEPPPTDEAKDGQGGNSANFG